VAEVFLNLFRRQQASARLHFEEQQVCLLRHKPQGLASPDDAAVGVRLQALIFAVRQPILRVGMAKSSAGPAIIV